MNIQFEGFKYVDGSIFAPAEFVASGVSVATNIDGKCDLGMVLSKTPCTFAAVYPENVFINSDYMRNKKGLDITNVRAIVFNCAGSNTFDKKGEEAAEKMAEVAGKALEISASQVAVASTGAIGQKIPADLFENAIPSLAKDLDHNHLNKATDAMFMQKASYAETAVEFQVRDIVCKIGAVAKYCRETDCLFCIITTDALIEEKVLKKALNLAFSLTLKRAFRSNNVYSPNDTVNIFASGFAGNKRITHEDKHYEKFLNGLYIALLSVAKQLVKNENGKLIECICVGADDNLTAKKVVDNLCSKERLISNGEIDLDLLFSAIGSLDARYDANDINITISTKDKSFAILSDNKLNLDYDYEMLLAEEIKIIVDLNNGNEKAISWCR